MNVSLELDPARASAQPRFKYPLSATVGNADIFCVSAVFGCFNRQPRSLVPRIERSSNG